MVQLNEIATQVKSRLETVITKIKPTDTQSPSTSSSSESPHPASAESLNVQTAKVVDAVFNTLFGACSGNNGCTGGSNSPHSTNDKSHIILNQRFQSNQKMKLSLSKKQKQNISLQKTPSNIESKYAQYYQDDHGVAARAVLMASEREEKEKLDRRERWKVMNKLAKDEAVNMSVVERRRQRRDLGTSKNDYNDHDGYHKNKTHHYSNYPTQERRKTTTLSSSQQQVQIPQHREHMQVNGNPFILAEVVPQSSSNEYPHEIDNDESESNISYNYDDGISALSAHTLEEMAKIDAILQSRYRREKEEEPKEQGFDISLEQLNVSRGDTTTTTAEATLTDCSGSKSGSVSGSKLEKPPSPVATEQSYSSQESFQEDDYYHEERKEAYGDKKQSLQLQHQQQYSAHKQNTRKGISSMSSTNNKYEYPVQMARNSPSHVKNSTDESNTNSHTSSKPQFSERWRSSEQQYWSQLVEEDAVQSPTKQVSFVVCCCYHIYR